MKIRNVRTGQVREVPEAEGQAKIKAPSRRFDDTRDSPTYGQHVEEPPLWERVPEV